MTTVSEKNRERILEAIDQLRRRKARPDIQRICNYLFRRFSINSSEAKSDLQWCVDNNIVRKVEYKGSISYRNATKKVMNNHNKQQQQQHHLDNNNTGDSQQKFKRKFSKLLMTAFGELVVQEPDYLEFGVPAADLFANILSKDSVRYTKKCLNELLEKEVRNRSVVKLENGNYMMGPDKKNDSWQSVDVLMLDDDDYRDERKKKRPVLKANIAQRKMENGDSDERKSDNVYSRVGGRRKRAKKVFDPSDIHVPKKRGRPTGALNSKHLSKSQNDDRPESRNSSNGRTSEQGSVCSVCHIQNKKGTNDRMVSCRECSNKAHYSCLNNNDDMMLKMYPDNSWQCPHCKTCVVCFETADAGPLYVCSICADGYHSTCHQTKITDKQKWICMNCQMPDDLKVHEIRSKLSASLNNSKTDVENVSLSNSGNTSPSNNFNSPPMSPTPPQLSPQTGLAHESPDPDSQSNKDSDDNKDFEENIDPTIPDATNWTYEEVYQYFAQYFPEEAHIFRDQEIDGRSLLLLKRIDVLTNLQLKLGPALKMYRHIVKLQVRRDDPKLYWL